MPPDVDFKIRFDYPDIVSGPMSENYAVGWKDGRWEQYWVLPTPDMWGGHRPIFLAAQEAILDHFGLGPEAVDLTTLSTASPTALQSKGCGARETDPYYTVKSVTSFVEWLDNRGPGWTGNDYRAERLASGEWVVGRLDENLWRWVVEPQRFSDLDMWQMFKVGAKQLSAGRLRSFRWKSLFLAHSSADKDFVRTLATRLRALGIRVWIDEAEIQVGDSLIDRIESGIDEMDYIGVVLSPESVNSRWVREELKMAMIKQLQDGEIAVLPILLRATDIPGFLREKRYADFRDGRMFDNAVSDLLDRLHERFPDPHQDKGHV
jgi:hypothetical protein